MKLLAPEKCHTYALIIRIGYPCGDEDREACAEELWERGSWIGEGQPGRDFWLAFQDRKMGRAELCPCSIP